VKSLRDVTLSFHTLGEVDLETRAAAAEAAGFRRVGLSIRRTRTWLENHQLSELTDLLERHGLVVGELEALRHLLVDHDEHEEFALALARELAVPLLQVIGPVEGALDEGAARLGRLADRAADQGMRVSLEFLPWTNVATIAAAAELVTAAGRANAGICIDVWHLYRSGGSVAAAAELWPYVASIQLDDGPLVADVPDDLHRDCLHHRRLPGDGDFDLVTLLAEAERSAPGYALSVEVISDRLRALPPGQVAQLAATASSRTLTAVEESSRV
jgi:sugar phosphate isomerase/epimerase